MRGEHGRRGSLKGEDPKVIYSQKLDEVVDLFGESKGFRQKEREAEDPMRAAMSKFSGQADKVVKGIHLYTLGARRMRKGLLKPTKREEYEDDFIREADDLDVSPISSTHADRHAPHIHRYIHSQTRHETSDMRHEHTVQCVYGPSPAPISRRLTAAHIGVGTDRGLSQTHLWYQCTWQILSHPPAAWGGVSGVAWGGVSMRIEGCCNLALGVLECLERGIRWTRQDTSSWH
jgi:hypothetical protein